MTQSSRRFPLSPRRKAGYRETAGKVIAKDRSGRKHGFTSIPPVPSPRRWDVPIATARAIVRRHWL